MSDRPWRVAVSLVKITVARTDPSPGATDRAAAVWRQMLTAMVDGDIPGDEGPMTTEPGRYTTYVKSSDWPRVRAWLEMRTERFRP